MINSLKVVANPYPNHMDRKGVPNTKERKWAFEWQGVIVKGYLIGKAT